MEFQAAQPQWKWLESVPGPSWQFNEANILKAIIEKIGMGSGRVAEVGAGNGTDSLPVTLDFLYKEAYRFTLYEANTDHHAALKKRYPGARIEGRCHSLHVTPYADGIVVIDVDSIDWYLFATLLANKDLPRLVMVEHWNGPDDQTPSPLRVRCDVQATWRQLVDLAAGLMTPVGRTLVNTIFVRDDLVGAI